ncbi:alpha/beta hydrolase family protein [uncultured Corynebacterium sp.]|uniref:alpha/beta hydrolase n=1 Tax=uncultured Corynebacterium sp. TaxID=159447 RepID=UPI0025E4EC0E|nr:alpha/beta hydrolase family protein [uncultured Corynebacterium sp.]
MNAHQTAQGWGKKILSLMVALTTAMGLVTIASPSASAADNRTRLRPGCTWSPYKFYVQNCWVYSPAMKQKIKVQIKPASRGGNAGLYMLDGLRARQDWNGWTYQGRGVDAFVNDNVTLVMPVGGQAQFYADWIAPYGGTGGPKKPKWETFLTRELPGYLQRNFGVSPRNNAVVGLSMGGTAAMNLAAWHRNQFKHVSSLSGYLNPTWPGMYLGLQYAMVQAGGPGARIWDMWGSPVDPIRFRNDPTVQAGRYRGMPMYLSAAGGMTTAKENFLNDPSGVASGVALEWLSRTSTAKFEVAARVAGARPVVSYPATGVHNWPYWNIELRNARPHILRALNA